MKKSYIRINILTPFPHETFIRQLPAILEEEGFIFYENGPLEEAWDMVVVYQGLNEAKSLKYIQGGLVFISGEPPFSQKYSTGFLSQFDHLITSHPQIKHPNNHITQQALPWHFGLSYRTKKFNYSFDDLLKMPLPEKTKKVSFITSNKRMMPGHKQRMIFLEAMKNEFGDAIDLFGQGINLVDDKAEALLSYQFSICIENSSINHYWTEKIADPLLAYCVPIYYGCKNIDEYFNVNALVKIDTKHLNKSIKAIENVLLNADKIYTEKLPQLKIERNKLIKEYNLFSVLSRFYYENIHNQFQPEYLINLRPSENFRDHHIKMNVLRLKRYILRYF